MKAMILFELPNNLDISLEDIKASITVESKDVRKSMLYLKFKNCEVKPLPNSFGIDIDDPYAIGWNACLRRIVGDINDGLQRCMGDTE